MMSGSNRTVPAPRYRIQRTRTPCWRRPAGSGRGFGLPSTVAGARRVRVSDTPIVCAGLPVIDGGRLSWSRSVSFVADVIKDGSRAAFLAMRSLSTSHSGWSQPLAWLVFPWVVSVHTSRRSFGQSAGTTVLNTHHFRDG